MRVKSVLNNSALIAQDIYQNDVVLVGKGIAFGKKVGSFIDPKSAERRFGAEKDESSNLLDLLKQVPSHYFEIASNIISYASEQLKKKFDKHIYITMTDHISCAVERYNENIIINNGLLSEISLLYPEEYRLAIWALEYVNTELDIRLPSDEAGFIAFHIINASGECGSVQAVKKIMQIVKDISGIVIDHYHLNLARQSLDYTRFLTHLKYFAFRRLNAETYNDDFPIFPDNHPLHERTAPCIEKICCYCKQELKSPLSASEAFYLKIHIYRLVSKI